MTKDGARKDGGKGIIEVEGVSPAIMTNPDGESSGDVYGRDKGIDIEGNVLGQFGKGAGWRTSWKVGKATSRAMLKGLMNTFFKKNKGDRGGMTGHRAIRG